MIIEQGGATNDAFSTPTILMYTSKALTAPYAPSTLYGAWATFASSTINLSSSTNNFISLFGANATGLPTGATTNSIFIQAASGVYQSLNSNGIILQAATSSGQSGTYSQIILDTAGAITIQGKGTVSSYTPAGSSRSYTNPTLPYLKINNQGIQMTSFPYVGDLSDTMAGNTAVSSNKFVRMVIQSPYTDSSGQNHLVTGPAIYYYQTTTTSTGGVVGDIWIVY